MRPNRTVTFASMIGAATLLTATACASSSPSGTSGTSSGTSAGSSASSSADSSGPTVKITSPANGATVTEPFTLKIASSVPIGATSSGNDHVHVFLDGSTAHYTVVTGTTTKVKSLPNGQHTIMVSLRNADHSPAGATAQITVNVTGSSASTGTGSGGGGGY